MARGIRLASVCAFVTVTAVVAAPQSSSELPAVAPGVTGLAVKLAPSRTESGETSSSVADRLKGKLPGGSSRWRVAPLGSAGDTFQVRVIPSESGGGALMTAAAAWEAAHKLRRDARVEFAEPVFVVNGARGETTEIEDCRPGGGPVPESGTDSPALPGAVADSEWSVGAFGANVIEAWKLFPADQVPGQGIWIGHPDTGYRFHREIWMKDGPIRADLGWDFVKGGPDPLDAFEEGTLKNPGHGTRTSSVIVSPRGRQLSGTSTRMVSGVAPGARLVPLRVANGVVQFDQTNLASAIREASGNDRTHVKQKVDVISISLGGPPSRALKDAVTFAEQQGVLVLAAAGNQVKTVVFPARYDNVIAVAASNVDSKTWSGSSAGSAVDVTAPGESVWVASPKAGNPDPLDCLQMGSGTSYAVATTAGVAALWMSRHAADPAFQALRAGGRQTDAFRRVLQENVRTVPGWNTGSYGPGIVDARKILSAPLPKLTEAAAAPVDRCGRDLETLELLFDGTPDARTRIRELFGKDPCRIASYADELAFLYSTNDAVRAALDPLMTPAQPQAADYRRAREAARAAASKPLRDALPR